MGLELRRATTSNGSAIPAKDYPLNATYATTAKKGDIVRLNASGELVQATTSDTTVLGALVGFNFEGAGQNPKVGKVIISGDAIYEATKVGAGALTVGVEYGIDGASNMDTADTTVKILQIVEVVNGKPYVAIKYRQLT
jgi:hypothetical protein